MNQIFLLSKISRNYFEGGSFLAEVREDKKILADILNEIIYSINEINLNLINNILVSENSGEVLISKNTGDVLISGGVFNEFS
jgi:hypothetical protein